MFFTPWVKLCSLLTAPHLDGDGDVRRDDLAHARDNFEGRFGLAKMIPAPATADRRLHRAAEIDVDDIETGVDESLRSELKLSWVGAHQLATDGVIFVRDVQMPPNEVR